jgi:hypothetical protein
MVAIIATVWRWRERAAPEARGERRQQNGDNLTAG